MQIKRYMAEDMRQALKLVRDEQGPDAVILSSRQLADGLEVVAAVDYDESLIEQTLDRRGAATAPRPPEHRESSAASTARVKAAEEPLSSMREEIKALRRMLECQLSSLAWNDFSRHSPVRADLLRNLIHLGLASPLAQDLTAGVPADERDPARAWRLALAGLARRVPVASQDPLAQDGVIALVGPTGVGKTTAIARLAAHHAQRHGCEQVAMISTDNSRPGAQERLFSFGRLLNIPVYLAAGAEEVQERLARMGHVRVVLLDKAGTARDDSHFRQLEALVRVGGRPLTPWLVLAANAQIQALEEMVMLYGRLPLAGAIATKLDEAASLGGLISVLANSELPLALVSDSPELSLPLRTPNTRKLVKRAVALMRVAPRRMDRESLAQHIGEVHYALG